jgi:hypothetical protein
MVPSSCFIKRSLAFRRASPISVEQFLGPSLESTAYSQRVLRGEKDGRRVYRPRYHVEL